MSGNAAKNAADLAYHKFKQLKTDFNYGDSLNQCTYLSNTVYLQTYEQNITGDIFLILFAVF